MGAFVLGHLAGEGHSQMKSFSKYKLEWKLQEGRDFVCLCVSIFLAYTQYPAHTKLSIFVK